MTSKFKVEGLFPNMVYSIIKDSGIDSTEKKEIEDIIGEGEGETSTMIPGISTNTYIFNTKLKKIKEFCEHHIKVYSEKIINPREELDFYITQSWLNVIKPGKGYFPHRHPNSILSGVFYVSTRENDKILFHDPLERGKIFQIGRFPVYSFGVENCQLILFPSWLTHGVEPNEATKDRISLSFNTFVKGTFGNKEQLSELII